MNLFSEHLQETTDNTKESFKHTADGCEQADTCYKNHSFEPACTYLQDC